MRFSERLARMRLAREAADADATFSPAVNDKSLRMALAKQIRELRDEVPASQRLSAARPLPAPTPGGQPAVCHDLVHATVLTGCSLSKQVKLLASSPCLLITPGHRHLQMGKGLKGK